MSSDIAIRVDGLGKSYTIRHQQSDHVTLAQVALERARHPFRQSEKEDFWALRDVSFEVKHGEVLGLIGRNGAGKSTLLKLLTRITAPSAGRIDLWGRVGSLLEVGTGFHPELTGRENVYLNGSILGMSRKEIDRQFDAIVDFAGVETFLDTPVKRYSSGMYVRLAFAVAAHLETEILLLDEVLAVGDGDFQERCFQKVSSLASGGRTVILVSHNLAAIRRFSDNALLLEAGTVAARGTTATVLESYQNDAVASANVDTSGLPRVDPRWGSTLRITRVTLNGGDHLLGADRPVGLNLSISAQKGLGPLCVSVQVNSIAGEPVGAGFTETAITIDAGDSSIDVVIPRPALGPGRYTVTVAIGLGDFFRTIDVLDAVLDSASFEVSPPVDSQGRLGHWNASWGSVRYSDLQAEVVARRTRIG